MKYTFELLVIDPNGSSEIQSAKSLLHGLLSTEKLWNEPKDKQEGEFTCINDGDITLTIMPIDTSSVLYDLYESAFIIKVGSDCFERLEKFRYPLILHFKGRLRFEHIRILTDDISTSISKRIYPLINELENILRRYIAKFFTQKIGLDWWKQAVPDKVIDKTKLRGSNETVFSKLVATDMTLIDFDDLGEIIYKHKLGFNKPENLAEKILSIKSDEELQKLKSDLDSNYNRFFKQHFKDYGFDIKWKKLFQVRNKVAHNNLFVNSDLESAETLYKELKEIILKAENSINDFKFSVEEQEAMIQAASTVEKSEQDEIKEEVNENELLPQPKVLGKIDLDDFEDDYSPFEIITEEELLSELKRAQNSIKRSSTMKYVGLKSFVTKVLGSKGYKFGPTYALINILRDKGIVDIYDIEDDYSFWPVKAVKLIE